MGFTINTSQFEAKVANLIATSPDFTKKAIDTIATYTVKEAIANLDKNGSVVTGKLKNSINYTSQVTGAGAKATVGPNAVPKGTAQGTDTKQYGYYVEYGRGPVIAKNKKALHFTINGNDVFVKSVGAAPAKPFLRPALESTKQNIKQILQIVYQQYVRS